MIKGYDSLIGRLESAKDEACSCGGLLGRCLAHEHYGHCIAIMKEFLGDARKGAIECASPEGADSSAATPSSAQSSDAPVDLYTLGERGEFKFMGAASVGASTVSESAVGSDARKDSESAAPARCEIPVVDVCRKMLQAEVDAHESLMIHVVKCSACKTALYENANLCDEHLKLCCDGTSRLFKAKAYLAKSPKPVMSGDSIIGALELLHLAIYHIDPHRELLIRSKEILSEIKGAGVKL